VDAEPVDAAVDVAATGDESAAAKPAGRDEISASAQIAPAIANHSPSHNRLLNTAHLSAQFPRKKP
jgi:hypothetical protein